MDQENEIKVEISLMHNKKVPVIFLDAFVVALKYFPELIDKYIFIYETPFSGVQHTSRAYPPILNLFISRKKWVYSIVINKNQDINIAFYKLSLEKQVGLLAHELSHSLAYSNYSRWKMIIFSFKYALSKKFVKIIEKETDLRVIEKGAGKHLFKERIDIFKFRKDNPYSDTDDIYIGPNELLDNLKKYPSLYSQSDINECLNVLKEVEKDIGPLDLSKGISFNQEIRHVFKTIIAFVPEFVELLYVVIIKKSYLK